MFLSTQTGNGKKGMFRLTAPQYGQCFLMEYLWLQRIFKAQEVFRQAFNPFVWKSMTPEETF